MVIIIILLKKFKKKTKYVFYLFKKGCSISKNGIKIFFEMLNSNKILKKVFIKGERKYFCDFY